MQALAIVEPIDRDVQLIFADDLSPVARSRALAEYATEEIAAQVGAAIGVYGSRLLHRTFVDGRETDDLNSVRPDGEIEADFDLLEDTLSWISNELRKLSPVRSGRYQQGHALYADGREVFLGTVNLSDEALPLGTIPFASEYVFINALSYAHKIETGLSEQAPRGVYEIVAARAAAKFGNIALIRFAYRAPFEGALVGGKFGNRVENRRPAIVVTMR